MPAIATEQNKRMFWDEMVKEYPNRWVVIKDAEMEGDFYGIIDADINISVD